MEDFKEWKNCRNICITLHLQNPADLPPAAEVDPPANVRKFIITCRPILIS